MATETNLEISSIGLRLNGWKATGLILTIWLLPAVVAFGLGIVIGRL